MLLFCIIYLEIFNFIYVYGKQEDVDFELNEIIIRDGKGNNDLLYAIYPLAKSLIASPSRRYTIHSLCGFAPIDS